MSHLALVDIRECRGSELIVPTALVIAISQFAVRALSLSRVRLVLHFSVTALRLDAKMNCWYGLVLMVSSESRPESSPLLLLSSIQIPFLYQRVYEASPHLLQVRPVEHATILTSKAVRNVVDMISLNVTTLWHHHVLFAFDEAECLAV